MTGWRARRLRTLISKSRGPVAFSPSHTFSRDRSWPSIRSASPRRNPSKQQRICDRTHTASGPSACPIAHITSQPRGDAGRWRGSSMKSNGPHLLEGGPLALRYLVEKVPVDEEEEAVARHRRRQLGVLLEPVQWLAPCKGVELGPCVSVPCQGGPWLPARTLVVSNVMHDSHKHRRPYAPRRP
jgi:hypothetical protein